MTSPIHRLRAALAALAPRPLSSAVPLAQRGTALRKALEEAAALRRPGAATDAWYNPRTGVGVAGRDRSTDTSFDSPSIIPRELAVDLWRGSALVRRIVSKRASVALSRGVSLSVDKGDAAWLHGELRRLRALARLREARWWASLYGGALVIANCDGGGNPDEPLDLRRLRQVVNLRVVDRHQVQMIEYAIPTAGSRALPTTTTQLSRDGEPVFYRLHPTPGAGLSLRIHASRVFRLDGAPLPFEARRANQGWDDSVLVGVFGALSRRGIGLAALATQIQDSNVGVWKIKGFHDMILSEQQEVQAWLEAMVLFRGVLGDYALDADGEDFEYKTKPLKDSKEVFEELLFDLAAEADMPFTELYGRSPAGMNATGESDRRKWHESIDAGERPIFEEAISDWLVPMLQAQTTCPRELRTTPVTLTWPSLEVLTAEQEETRRKTRVESIERLVNAHVITAEEARRQLADDPIWELDESAPDSVPVSDAALAIGQACDGELGDGGKVGLFLRLPPELASGRPSLSEDDSPAHVTFLVLGDVRGREADLLALIRRELAQHQPVCRAFLGRVDALTNREGEVVVYQHVDFSVPSVRGWSAPLHELRRALVERLRQHNYPVRDASPDDWHPHLTLAYLADPRATWTGAPLSGSWHVGELEVWGLPAVARLPLDGSEPSTDQRPSAQAEAELAAWLDATEPEVRAALLEAWDEQRGQLTVEEVVAALTAGDWSGEVLRRWRESYSRLVTLRLAPLWRQGAPRAGASVAAQLGININAPALAGRLETWIGAHGGELAVHLSDQQHEAMREVLRQAIAVEGVAPPTLATQLRPFIGLTPGDARSVATLRRDLATEGVLTPAQIDRAVAERAVQLQRARTELIARTEMAGAYNEATVQAARQAQVEHGLGAMTKVWLTGVDERVCSVCGPLHETKAPLHGRFAGGLDRPPAHPACRCTTVIELAGSAPGGGATPPPPGGGGGEGGSEGASGSGGGAGGAGGGNGGNGGGAPPGGDDEGRRKRAATSAQVLRGLQGEVRWKPGSDMKHLTKRIKKGHMAANATLDDYNGTIRAVVGDEDGRLYDYVFNGVHYPVVVTTIGGREWLVMTGTDGLMETAFVIDSDTYLDEGGFVFVGHMRDHKK